MSTRAWKWVWTIAGVSCWTAAWWFGRDARPMDLDQRMGSAAVLAGVACLVLRDVQRSQEHFDRGYVLALDHARARLRFLRHYDGGEFFAEKSRETIDELIEESKS